jgi:hypothetical protein
VQLVHRLHAEWRASLTRHGRFPLLFLRLHNQLGLRKVRYLHCVPLRHATTSSTISTTIDEDDDDSDGTDRAGAFAGLRLAFSATPTIFLSPRYFASLPTADGGVLDDAVLSTLASRAVTLLAHFLDAEFPRGEVDVDRMPVLWPPVVVVVVWTTTTTTSTTTTSSTLVAARPTVSSVSAADVDVLIQTAPSEQRSVRLSPSWTWTRTWIRCVAWRHLLGDILLDRCRSSNQRCRG